MAAGEDRPAPEALLAAQTQGAQHVLIMRYLLTFELGPDGAVDEEVGGEVEHDEEMGDALQAHDPPGRDVLVQQLHARHLHICNILILIASVQ